MMDEIDLLLCLDVEKCAASYRRQKIASLEEEKQEPVLPESWQVVEKSRARRMDYESEDLTEKDSFLMPPPRKRTRFTSESVKNSSAGYSPFNTDGGKQEDSFHSGNTLRDKPMESATLLHPSSPVDQTFLVSIYDTGFISGFPFGNFAPSLGSFPDFDIYEDPYDCDIYDSQLDPRWYPSAGEDKENMSERELQSEDADTEMEDTSETDESPHPTRGGRMVLHERVLQEQLLEMPDVETDEEPVLPVVHIAMGALAHLAEQQAHNVGLLA
ncbi:hypothetical protein PVAR5_6870 [Paecilomyces variotii No. 5]|uniref:Uncharacterized protein n=1 Tax=Byssochlamys spectabilis (strain No. 5 / NBRC 109023) TaxID=1356009 RepID=V5FJY6_BYSSN|nr:hypothetical protein PVAR5_6870 [Paecilomyces variotii No. 5]